MVADTFFKFREYTNRTDDLLTAVQKVKRALQNLGDFTSQDKRLVQRALGSKRLVEAISQDRSEVNRLLDELIVELEHELKSLTPLIESLKITSAELFSKVKNSIIAHQSKQHSILQKLYTIGIDLFNNLDKKIRASVEVIEDTHKKFVIKTHELLSLLVSGHAQKGTIANAWTDVLEYLVLYARDDFELGLSHHNYGGFTQGRDSDGYSQRILRRYFYALSGETQYVKELRRLGLIRKVADINNGDITRSHSQFIDYNDLEDSTQDKIDKVIKQSLLDLLEGISYTLENKTYQWGNKDDENSLCGVIEKMYKGESKITKELLEELDSIILTFYQGVVERYGSLILGDSDFNKMKLSKKGNTDITIEKLKDDTFRKDDKNFDIIKECIILMRSALSKDSKVMKSIYESNKDLFGSTIGSGGDLGGGDEWFEGVSEASSLIDFNSVLAEIITTCQGVENDSMYSGDVVDDSSKSDFSSRLDELRRGCKIVGKSLSSKDYFSGINKDEFKQRYKLSYEGLRNLNISSSKSAIISVVSSFRELTQQLQSKITP